MKVLTGVTEQAQECGVTGAVERGDTSSGAVAVETGVNSTWIRMSCSVAIVGIELVGAHSRKQARRRSALINIYKLDKRKEEG